MGASVSQPDLSGRATRVWTVDESQFSCPACGSSDTRRAEMVWKAGNSESIVDGAITDAGADGEWVTGRSWSTSELARSAAPPAERAAASDAGRFYRRGSFGLVGWVIGAAVLCTVLAAFPFLVILVVAIAIVGGVIQLIRLVGGSPKPTTDQRSAHEEWKIAYAEWQRQWLCLRCGESFAPDA